MDDYYEILGIDYKADLSEIKKAYRKLVLEFHPDRNVRPDAKALFIKVDKAYDILSNPSQRNKYDKLYQAFVLQKNSDKNKINFNDQRKDKQNVNRTKNYQ